MNLLVAKVRPAKTLSREITLMKRTVETAIAVICVCQV